MRLGEYELGAELGRGAMGVVYRARQPRLRREVAVKVILASRFAGESARKRFLAEAELAAHLDHPNIVPIYEVGETADGPFYAMKLVERLSNDQCLIPKEARSPKHKLEAASKPDSSFRLGPSFDIRHSAFVILKIARAVHHAHQRGVLHRDLKPGNILIDAQGEPHVTDFGLARQLGVESSLTLSGATLGTPAYMSPEQARGEKTLTVASDVWSLGAVLYHLLAGRPPFEGESALEVMRKVMEEEAEPPSRFTNDDLRLTGDREESRVNRKSKIVIPADLETICLKCLEKDPARRYGSALALAEDLERWLNHEPIRARPSSAGERLVKWARRNPARATLAAALLVMSLVGVAGITWQWRRAEQNAQQARARLLQMHLLNVQHSFNEGDPLGALPWLAGALQEEPKGSLRRTTYELSFASALRMAVLPERMWFLPERARGLQISADGKRVAAYSTTGVAMVWRTDSGEPLFPLGTVRGAWGLALSSDGRRLVIGDAQRAKLYELPSGRKIKDLLHGGAVARMAFSADSRWLATGSENGVARIWSTEDGVPVTGIFSHTGPVSTVAFGPDGRLLTVDRERALILWDIATGRELRRQEGIFWEANYNAEGTQIVAAFSQTHEARVYDGNTLQPLTEPMRHAGHVSLAFFSPDGTRIGTASRDGTARVWDAASGRPVSPPLVHDLEVYSIAFSPDSRSFATGSRDLKARLWDANTGQPLTPWLRHGGTVDSILFTPDGRHIVTGGDDGVVRLWALRADSENEIALPEQAAGLDRAWASPDGSKVVTLTHANRVGLWSAITGKSLIAGQDIFMALRQARFSPNAERVLLCGAESVRILSTDGKEAGFEFKPGDDVSGIEWHPNGMAFFTANGLGELIEWNAATGARRRELSRADRPVYNLRISRDGKYLAGLEGPYLFSWNLITGESRRHRVREDTDFRSIHFSPDGRLLIGGCADGIVTSLDLQTAKWNDNPYTHSGWVLDVNFSPDSRQIAVVADDGSVSICDSRTGQMPYAPFRPPGGVNRCRFSPDGRFLGTASVFASQIWYATTGNPVTPLFHFPRNLVEGPVFSADSRSVFFVTEDARLVRHDLNAPEWPEDMWQSAARLLSGQAVTENGGLQNWKPGKGAAQAWATLREQLKEVGPNPAPPAGESSDR